MAKKSKKENVEEVLLSEDFETIESIEDVIEDVNKSDKSPEKEFVKDWKQLKKVEGYKQTDRGKFYYGVKK